MKYKKYYANIKAVLNYGAAWNEVKHGRVSEHARALIQMDNKRIHRLQTIKKVKQNKNDNV